MAVSTVERVGSGKRKKLVGGLQHTSRDEAGRVQADAAVLSQEVMSDLGERASSSGCELSR